MLCATPRAWRGFPNPRLRGAPLSFFLSFFLSRAYVASLARCRLTSWPPTPPMSPLQWCSHPSSVTLRRWWRLHQRRPPLSPPHLPHSASAPSSTSMTCQPCTIRECCSTGASSSIVTARYTCTGLRRLSSCLAQAWQFGRPALFSYLAPSAHPPGPGDVLAPAVCV